MMRDTRKHTLALLLLALNTLNSNAFSVLHTVPRNSVRPRSSKHFSSTSTEEVNFKNSQDEEFVFQSPEGLKTAQVKELLLGLLPRMTGKPEEYKAVEAYVNALEDGYSPVQTLDFLNLAMAGDWQLLFSTNLARGPKPTFRIRELVQSIEPSGREGSMMNQATWELIVDGPNFDSSGTFTAKCEYEVTQGSRMTISFDDHLLELAKGARVPKDVPELVGLLHRAMPKELFDPNDHSMDTTYLDGDLRIVRMTGTKFEGVRDIFIRKGSMEINPTAA